MKNVRFGYFQVRTATGTGYVCVALQRPTKERSANESHRAGFALCSPKDCFSKKMARKIAVARLTEWRDLSKRPRTSYWQAGECVSGDQNMMLKFNPRVEFFTMTEPTSKVIIEALEKLVAKPEAPNWLRTAFKHNAVKPGLTQVKPLKQELIQETLKLIV